MSCIINAQEEIPIPAESQKPFYFGTIEITQFPTDKNMSNDLVMILKITYKKDSTGNWPQTYYGYEPYPKVPINAVEVAWSPAAYYGDTLGFLKNGAIKSRVESIQTRPQELEWIRLPAETDSVTHQYKITFSGSNYEDLPPKTSIGALHLFFRVSFNGGNISENPSEAELKTRFNYSSMELVWFTPLTNTVRHRSLGSMEEPAVKIVR